MNKNFYGLLFRIIRQIIRLIYPKYMVRLPKNIHEPVVYISHHQNTFGPFVIILWFPKCLHAWILHVFLDQRKCYKHYVDFTFTERFGLNKSIAKLFAFPISLFISKLLNSGMGIPVYRGSKKIVRTLQYSIDALNNNESIVIFPDIDYKDTSSKTKEMYDGFLYIEKYYHQATGKHVCFIPIFASKKNKLLIADSQIFFRDGEDFNTERKIVYQQIHENLNQLAKKYGGN